MASRMRKTRIIAPRAMPIFAPMDSPFEFEEVEVDEDEDESDVPVELAGPSVPVGVKIGVVTVDAYDVEMGILGTVVDGGITVPPEGRKIVVLAVTES